MKRKAALYVRGINDLGAPLNIKNCSAYQQSTGLEAQVRALKEYCKLNNVTQFELYTDEGISGTKNSRPALDRMMAEVRGGGVGTVVVYSFSRFARSTTHLLAGLEDMKKTNTNFSSLTERIDTNSPIGKAVFVIISAIAQLERDSIAERVRNGLANARAKGRLIGRKKLRDSDLIRKLLKSGLSYRACASIAKCSHGSVHQEKLAMKRDEEKAKRLAEEQAKAEALKLDQTADSIQFPTPAAS